MVGGQTANDFVILINENVAMVNKLNIVDWVKKNILFYNNKHCLNDEFWSPFGL